MDTDDENIYMDTDAENDSMDDDDENYDACKKREKVIILAAAAVVIAVEYYSKFLLNRKKRKKRKKGDVEKISSLLKAIATAIKQLVENNSRVWFGKQVSNAIDAIPGIDFKKKWHAKLHFMRNKNDGSLLLAASDEDKPKVLELYIQDIEACKEERSSHFTLVEL